MAFRRNTENERQHKFYKFCLYLIRISETKDPLHVHVNRLGL